MILNLSAVRGTHKVPGQPSPAGHHSHLAMAVCLYHTNYGNKKDVGSKFLRAYPSVQALALPPSKDKQLKACPRRDYICIHHGMTHPKQHSCTVHIQYTYYTQLHIYTTMSVYLFLGIHLIIYKKGK